MLLVLLGACGHGARNPLRTDSATGNVSTETSPAAPASGVPDSLSRKHHQP